MSMWTWLARWLPCRFFIIDCFEMNHAFNLINSYDFHLIWSASIQKLLVAYGTKLSRLSFYETWSFENIWTQCLCMKVSEVFESQLRIHIENKSLDLFSQSKLGLFAGDTAEWIWLRYFYLFMHCLWFSMACFFAFLMMGGMFVRMGFFRMTHFWWNLFLFLLSLFNLNINIFGLLYEIKLIQKKSNYLINSF